MVMEIPGIIHSGRKPDLKVENNLKPVHHAQNNKKKVQQEFSETPLSLTSKNIKKRLQNIEKIISQFNRRFKIYVNKDINRIVIKVIDKNTDKIIKEIPPKEIQHLLAKIREIEGLLVDKRI